MVNILVSACLMGVKCRYDGSGSKSPLEPFFGGHTLIPVCPEQLGGLSTPREPAECSGRRVVCRTGRDVTEAFERGARETLRIGKRYHCRYAILKERSPSCGRGEIYDGTFSGIRISGDGVTASLLEKNGIQVMGESRLDRLAALLREEGKNT